MELCEQHDWQFSYVDDGGSPAAQTTAAFFLLPNYSKKCIGIASSLAPKIVKLGFAVHVYYIDEILTREKLEIMFPGIPSVSQTPVFLTIENGNITEFLQGEDVAGWSSDNGHC